MGGPRAASIEPSRRAPVPRGSSAPGTKPSTEEALSWGGTGACVQAAKEERTMFRTLQEGCGLATELLSVQRTLESQSQVAAAVAAQLGTLCSKVELLTAHTTIKPDVVNSNFSCGKTVAVPYKNGEAPNLRAIFNTDEEEEIVDVNPASKNAAAAGLFSGSDELKEQIRFNLQEERYHVTNFYKTTGIFQRIARSNRFEAASLLLVITSSFWMSVDLDMNHALLLHEASMGFQLAANMIALLFTVELGIRILAFRDVRNFVKDFWCMFDLVLVIFMILETWVLWCLIKLFDIQLSSNNIRMFAVFRMLRLVRVLRLIKLFRFLPELLVIVRGIGVAMRAISLVFILLFFVIYIGAIVFRVLLEGTPFGDKHFETVTHAMGTLLLDCALSGTRGGPLMREAYGAHPIYSLLLFAFVLLTNVTMMGLLVGLLVQTIKKVAEVEEEEKKQLRNRSIIDEFWKHVVAMDSNHDGYITIDEFEQLMSDRKTVKMLKTMDVDPESLVLLSDFVFAENQGRMGQEDFNQWVLDMRGSTESTRMDHIMTRKFVAMKLTNVIQDGIKVPSTRRSLSGPL